MLGVPDELGQLRQLAHGVGLEVGVQSRIVEFRVGERDLVGPQVVGEHGPTIGAPQRDQQRPRLTRHLGELVLVEDHDQPGSPLPQRGAERVQVDQQLGRVLRRAAREVPQQPFSRLDRLLVEHVPFRLGGARRELPVTGAFVVVVVQQHLRGAAPAHPSWAGQQDHAPDRQLVRRPGVVWRWNEAVRQLAQVVPADVPGVAADADSPVRAGHEQRAVVDQFRVVVHLVAVDLVRAAVVVADQGGAVPGDLLAAVERGRGRRRPGGCRCGGPVGRRPDHRGGSRWGWGRPLSAPTPVPPDHRRPSPRRPPQCWTMPWWLSPAT